jgi:hypothetical protein
MMDPGKYWPKWLLDMANSNSATKQLANTPVLKAEVDTEQLPNGCIVYKPDWTRRAARSE